MTKSSKEPDIKELRVVLVGYGLAGSVFHAPLIATTPGLSLSAIMVRNQERQAAARRDYPEATILDNVDSIWRESNLYDLVVVASPNSTHTDIAQKALGCGLPVVVDKPITTSVEECGRLISAAKMAGKMLTVFHNRRWDSDFLTVRKLIEDRTFGDITRFESRYERWRPSLKPGSWREQADPGSGGGLLFDLGSHLIDQVVTIFGAPLSVYAEVDIRREGGLTDDDVFLSLTFHNKVHVHLWISALACMQGPRFRVCGTKGTFEKYGMDPQEEALKAGARPGRGWGLEQEGAWGRLRTDTSGTPRETIIESVPGNYPAFYAAVRDALVNGGRPPVDPADALLTMHIIEAARQSARRRTVVDMQQVTLV